MIDMLEKRFPEHTFFMENDANAATWAEVRFGAAQNRRNVIMLTVGTGLGGGIVIDGRLVRGANGVAAEVGHIAISGCRARDCACAGYSGSRFGISR